MPPPPVAIPTLHPRWISRAPPKRDEVTCSTVPFVAMTSPIAVYTVQRTLALSMAWSINVHRSYTLLSSGWSGRTGLGHLGIQHGTNGLRSDGHLLCSRMRKQPPERATSCTVQHTHEFYFSSVAWARSWVRFPPTICQELYVRSFVHELPRW